MKESTRNIFLELLERYPALASAANEIEAAFELVRGAYEGGGKLLCGGNGGSACDCEHIVFIQNLDRLHFTSMTNAPSATSIKISEIVFL
jgi:phosphoheptose isomerase